MKKNYEQIFNNMVDKTQKYLENNNLFAMILGISGGIDSTVTAVICHEVEKRNPDLKFFGISLPCTSNSVDENNSAMTCMKAFCKENQYWVENIQKEYLLMRGTCAQRHSITTIGQGNLKARLRMMYLYNEANYFKGVVMDTDNLTEHYLGFFTIHGDVADINPIGILWKHEVYELANYLLEKYKSLYNYTSPDSFNSSDEIKDKLELELKIKALENAIGITPTDGNGVNDLGDMGQIAPAFATEKNVVAYTKVDDIIDTYLNKYSKEYMEILYDNYGKDTVDNVINRIKRTEYKRQRLPIVVTQE